MSKSAKPCVLITGVSSGIGRFLASALSGEFDILGTIRNPDQRGSLLTEIPGIRLYEMDMRDPEKIRSGWQQIETENKNLRLRALINNAGFALPGAIIDLEPAELQEQLQVNVIAPALMTRLSIPFLEPGEGRIINIGSVSGLFASPFLGAYAASKFAMEGMSDALRRELALLGLRVILIQPGPLKTPIWTKNLGLHLKHHSSLFTDYLTGADDQIRLMESGALPVESILGPVLSALKHRRPKNRYLVHRFPWLIRSLAHILPSRLADRMVLNRIKSKSKKFRPI